MQDRSREKSLLFLLSTVSRSLEASPENKVRIRESIATLQIQDSGDMWEISAELSNQVLKSLHIAKDRFIFYPVKSSARYETNPAILNKNSAQEVLLFLFSDYDVQVVGKKFKPVRRPFPEYLPVNLITAALFTLSSIYNLVLLSFVIIASHMFISTANHHTSSIRRWLLIAGVVIPALTFLSLNNSDSNGLQNVLSQIALLISFDFVIRVATNQKSKLISRVAHVFAFGSLFFVNTMQNKAQLSITLMSLIVLIGYILHRPRITSSLRNVMLLIYFGLLATFVFALVITNPLNLLLLPYLIYIALYETLFGDNRNPAKLAFGAVCLAI